MKNVLDHSKLHQYHLEKLCERPHPSGNEKAVCDYVMSVAEACKLKAIRDEWGNIIVRKPAAPGYDQAPPVILQAHMDMVCVRAPDSDHDFDHDPLDLYIDEHRRLHAKGTTLGADDAYGVAYLLTVMGESFPHPELELVFTVQEENGCHGVDALNCDLLNARRMIGLDVMGNDIEYTCCVGCFYSDRMILTREQKLIPAVGNALCVTVNGVQPIHESKPIHPEVQNAIKILARLLNYAGREGIRVNLSSMEGGVAENYNPVKSSAVVLVPQVDRFESVLRKEFDTIVRELDDGYQELSLKISPASASQMVCDADHDAMIGLLYMMPSGITAIHVKDGSITATNNIGTVTLLNGLFRLVMSDRTANPGYKDGILHRVEELARLYGAALQVEERYRSWEYRPDSPLLKTTASLMEETYGHKMIENICPGGLECCSMIPRMPGLDVVMFAPIGAYCHTTQEFLDLDSFDRVYVFLKTLLSKLNN